MKPNDSFFGSLVGSALGTAFAPMLGEALRKAEAIERQQRIEQRAAALAAALAHGNATDRDDAWLDYILTLHRGGLADRDEESEAVELFREIANHERNA